ncbi:MAG: GNAT family N-acetyltransferase [Pelomonas sp.]|nr:GNAT family N-acetyltransferase [Roseateles sp.]
MTPPSAPDPGNRHPGDWLGRLHPSRWVPIRPLSARHRRRILEHLLSLGARDRYLRFGYAASDEQVARYTERLDFGRDELLGIFNRRLELVAMAHLAYDPAPQRPGRPAMAEFGVSVHARARGKGVGQRLFDRAALHARNRGVGTLFIHALSENTPMLRIARRAGAKVEREGAESEAWLRLPHDTLSSHVDEALERHLAEVDFEFKRHLRTLRRWRERLRRLGATLFGRGGG